MKNSNFILNFKNKTLYQYKVRKLKIMATKFKQSTIREYVDVNTGEIQMIETSKTFTTKVPSDRFFMTFIDVLSPFFNIKSDNARKILVWMCQHAEFNTGIVRLTSADRLKMAEEIDICANTITNNLKKLKDAKLISGDKGIFQITPVLFWKGSMDKRAELLENKEIQITFGIEKEDDEKETIIKNEQNVIPN